MGARRSIHRLQRRSPPLEYSRAFGGGVVSRGVAGTESTDAESTLSLSSHRDHLHPLPLSVDADTVCTSFLASDCAFSTFGRCAKTPAEESRLCHGCRKVILLFVLFFIGSDIDSRLRPSRFLINNSKDRPMILEYLTPPVTAQMLRTSVTLCRM